MHVAVLQGSRATHGGLHAVCCGVAGMQGYAWWAACGVLWCCRVAGLRMVGCMLCVVVLQGSRATHGGLHAVCCGVAGQLVLRL